MKLKNKCIIFLAIYFMSIFFNYRVVYCVNIDIYDSTDKTDVVETVSDETYDTISRIISMISKELNNIDYKLDKARIMDEYERYPLIRLNIDSPYFGITSIVESRLKIKDAISTLDMAKGYNIRSMINSKSILVKDLEVTSIVITTRKIDISKDMSKEDANICVYKLLEYLNQVKSVSGFLDTELRNTFADYYTENKNINIMYIKNEIKNINLLLDDIKESLTKDNVMTTNNHTDDIDKCISLRDKVSEIEDVINNPLSSESELTEALIKSVSLKSEVTTLYNETKEKYDSNEVYDIDTLLKNSIIDMDDKVNYLKHVLKINENSDELTEESSISFYGRYLSSSEKYRDELSELLKSGKYDKVNLEDYTEDEIKNEINKIYSVYLKFLNSYNVALTQYIKIKLLEIRSENVLDELKSEDIIYIYIDIDKELLQISNIFDKNSVCSNIESTKNLRDILDRLVSLESKFEKES